jgi:hypothetical protein
MAVSLPDGLTEAHFQEIQKLLSQALGELQSVDPNVQRVTSRLNYSNTDNPIPIWVGIVEAKPIQDLRPGFEPGKARFGQSNRSAVYNEAVTKGGIIARDWCQDLAEKSKVGYGPAGALGPKAGCMHQLFIPLTTTEGRRFGTFTLASQKNLNRTLVDPVMRDWATEKKPYVQYLIKTFDLGGPK